MNPIIKTLTRMADLSVCKKYGSLSKQAEAVRNLIKEQNISE